MQADEQRSSQPRALSGAMDVHAVSMVVVRMMDGAKPQPPQTLNPAGFLGWIPNKNALAVPRGLKLPGLLRCPEGFRPLAAATKALGTHRETPASVGCLRQS